MHAYTYVVGVVHLLKLVVSSHSYHALLDLDLLFTCSGVCLPYAGTALRCMLFRKQEVDNLRGRVGTGQRGIHLMQLASFKMNCIICKLIIPFFFLR